MGLHLWEKVKGYFRRYKDRPGEMKIYTKKDALIALEPVRHWFPGEWRFMVKGKPPIQTMAFYKLEAKREKLRKTTPRALREN